MREPGIKQVSSTQGHVLGWKGERVVGAENQPRRGPPSRWQAPAPVTGSLPTQLSTPGPLRTRHSHGVHRHPPEARAGDLGLHVFGKLSPSLVIRCFKGHVARPETRAPCWRALLELLNIAPVSSDITPHGLPEARKGSRTGAMWPCLRQGQTTTDAPPYFRGTCGLSPKGLVSPGTPNQLGSFRPA